MGSEPPLVLGAILFMGFQPRHKPIMEYLTHINQQFDIRWFQDRVYPSPNHGKFVGKMMIIFWNVVFQRQKHAPQGTLPALHPGFWGWGYNSIHTHITKQWMTYDFLICSQPIWAAGNSRRIRGKWICGSRITEAFSSCVAISFYGDQCPLYFRVHPS